MPQRRNAVKRLRVDRTRKLRNQMIKTGLKKTIKKYLSSISSGKSDEAALMLKTVYSKLDKAAKKGVIHKNTALRRKSRLSKRLANKA